jgi:acyl dehydratase
VSENGFALGWDLITLPNPVFAGDTLYCEQRVVALRESKSRPRQGIVKIRTLGVKQDGTVVIDYTRSVMVWKRDHAPGRAIFPEPKLGSA